MAGRRSCLPGAATVAEIETANAASRSRRADPLPRRGPRPWPRPAPPREFPRAKRHVARAGGAIEDAQGRWLPPGQRRQFRPQDTRAAAPGVDARQAAEGAVVLGCVEIRLVHDLGFLPAL